MGTCRQNRCRRCSAKLVETYFKMCALEDGVVAPIQRGATGSSVGMLLPGASPSSGDDRVGYRTLPAW